MAFRVTGRHDSLLLAGLAFALLVIFQRSLQYLLDIAGDIERAYGVALVPALLILTVMLVFHLQANRREMRAEAAAAATEVALARARARELEQLMAFGQALSRTLTLDALHEAIWAHMPTLAGGADTWVTVRRNNEWERITDRGCARWPPRQIEAVAETVAGIPAERLEDPDGVEQDGFICYAMTVAGRTAGVVGLSADPRAAHVRRSVGAAATLLGIALRNAQLFAEVRDTGLKDALTGCFNRAHGLEALEAELARARRGGTPLSVLMFDVDQFKRINDQYGHLRGDQVLAAVGARIRQVLRKSDLRCRYGGDEFMVALPDTAAAGAARVAEWLRGEIEQIEVRDGVRRVTISISVGATTAQDDDDADALLERADRALYSAKAAGRNCVRTAPAGLRPVATVTAVTG